VGINLSLYQTGRHPGGYKPPSFTPREAPRWV